MSANPMAPLDEQMAGVFGALPKPQAPQPLPRETQDDYTARRTPQIARDLGRTHRGFASALSDVRPLPELERALRAGDDCELGRIFRAEYQRAMNALAESVAAGEWGEA